ncbi:MAG: hypothetical protein NWT02_00030 [Opitutales bacterium]|jgi:hypothetical protein|nr:hypothetical protein [Opitutales bacterium]MDP4645187.1 hypothetical protein [Opitutales bacterium]MDP4693210.1 hypothetical protein [Opitutales bacterium]MDP4778474.1 hypothetical protein [Opitutales bacterium]MDP4884510.1 hypothetical protein [Opitutales bacterium]
MSIQRKFKVTTSITQFMWASSRNDAEKFQEDLIKKGKLDIQRHGETEVKFCFTGGKDFLEAPEDISQTRNPVEEPRRGDWLEIEHGDVKACALVRRLSRRKIYYFEALSKTERSVDRERWQRWSTQHTIHPSYDGVVPPFIVDEAISAHEDRGMLSGFSATPDSSLILEILDKYGYVPDDYEVENGYWAEIYIDRAISEKILSSQEEPSAKTGTHDGVDEFGDFSVGFSEELPTIDDFENQF